LRARAAFDALEANPLRPRPFRALPYLPRPGTLALMLGAYYIIYRYDSDIDAVDIVDCRKESAGMMREE
jgi:plasmid stabilization system protein ParE